MEEELRRILEDLNHHKIGDMYKIIKKIESPNVQFKFNIDFNSWLEVDFSAKYLNKWLTFSMSSDGYPLQGIHSEDSNELLDNIKKIVSDVLNRQIQFGTFKNKPAMLIAFDKMIIVVKKRIGLSSFELTNNELDLFVVDTGFKIQCPVPPKLNIYTS